MNILYVDFLPFIKSQTNDASIENDSYITWQRMTTNGNGWYNEWCNKWQQMTMILISAKLLFLQIREKTITKHSKKDSLNQRPCEVPWQGPIVLRADLIKQVPKKKNQQQEAGIESVFLKRQYDKNITKLFLPRSSSATLINFHLISLMNTYLGEETPWRKYFNLIYFTRLIW